jgi:hypothetical protein
MHTGVKEPASPKGVRQWLEEHRAIGVTFTLACIAGAILLAVFHSRPHDEATFDFIDEETGKPSAEPITAVPPLMGASGKPTVVRAIYAGAQNSSGRKLLYLEKYRPDAKAYMEEYHRSGAKGPPNVPHPETAVYVRLPAAGSPWVTRDSAEGQRIMLQTGR